MGAAVAKAVRRLYRALKLNQEERFIDMEEALKPMLQKS
jgi:hypothetical protein